jgi:phage-related protein
MGNFLDDIQEFISQLIAKIDEIINFVIEGMPMLENIITQILNLFKKFVDLLVDNRNKLEMMIVIIPLLPLIEVVYQFTSAF